MRRKAVQRARHVLLSPVETLQQPLSLLWYIVNNPTKTMDSAP